MNRRLTTAKRILRKLADHGHEAYLVGGFVRDKLLGLPIKDFDIATSASPDQVMRLFERTEPTGLRHGTVTVVEGGFAFEVTTFRIETGYADHRRPDSVTFIRNVEGDLARRDFTINAMAMTADGRLIDPFGGARDLESGLLRCVGDPLQRFGEDALRLLRCIRFAAEYGLEIDAPTWDALKRRAPLLGRIALERVRTELERIVEGRDPLRGLRLLTGSGLLRHVKAGIGEVLTRAVPNGAAALDIGRDSPARFTPTVRTDPTGRTGSAGRTDPGKQPAPTGRTDRAGSGGSSALGSLNSAVDRWAHLFLLAGYDSEDCVAVLRELTFSGRKTEQISRILRFHEMVDARRGECGEALIQAWRNAVLTVGRPAAEAWLRIADIRQFIPGDGARIYSGLEQAAESGRAWLAGMPVYALHDLNIDGRDLLALGVQSGPALGRLLRRLLQEAAAGEIGNTREQLLGRAKHWIAKEG